MDLDAYLAKRPRAFHLTATSNLEHILADRRLIPSSEIFTLVGRPEARRRRRPTSEHVPFGDRVIHVRDQAPLHEGNARLAPGWTFHDLIEHLNDHVFFWPGTESRPIHHGIRYLQRYHADDCRVLDIGASGLCAANAPLFCRYNSGSPRCSRGVGSPRGPRTFVSAAEFEGTPSTVVELVFRGTVTLPAGPIAVRTITELLDGA